MLIYKDGTTSREGDMIRWFCDDRDDCTTWTFTGIVKREGVMYLGSGVDFGKGFGKMLHFDEVVEQSEDNEPYQTGIIKIGTAMDVVRLIENFGSNS